MNRDKAEIITQKVVELLENERVNRKISKLAIYEGSGLSRTAWTLIVSKRNSPTLRTLLIVSSVIGVDLKELIGKAENIINNA